MTASSFTAVARHLHALVGHSAQDLSDGQLLQQFADGQEEAAFAALVLSLIHI